jgi:hypothetical protein
LGGGSSDFLVSPTSITIPPPVPAEVQVALVGADNQNTVVNTAFATALRVQVLSVCGDPIPGAAVTFTAPVGGAGGAFAGGATSVMVVTGVGGYASPPDFIANALPGSYQVTASVSGVTDPTVFHLTNLQAKTTQQHQQMTPQLQDVTAQFRVILGRSLFNRATRRTQRKVFFDFSGSAAIQGPFWLVLADLSRKVRLRHSTGITQVFAPLGSPYLALSIPAVLPGPGPALTVMLEFSNPSGRPVHFTPHLLAGPGPV